MLLRSAATAAPIAAYCGGRNPRIDVTTLPTAPRFPSQPTHFGRGVIFIPFLMAAMMRRFRIQRAIRSLRVNSSSYSSSIAEL